MRPQGKHVEILEHVVMEATVENLADQGISPSTFQKAAAVHAMVERILSEEHIVANDDDNVKWAGDMTED